MSEIPEEPTTGASMRLFQITEDDLAELERLLPDFHEAFGSQQLGPNAPGANRLRVKVRRVKDIISNVRWNYAPHSDVQEIPAEPQ